MLNVEINGKTQELTNLAYHYQEKPWPGDGHYQITVPVTNKFRDFFKRRYGRNLNFEKNKKVPSVLEKDIDPIIQTIIDFFVPEDSKFQIKWVLNNVEKIKADNDIMILEGVCSRFFKNYRKPQ